MKMGNDATKKLLFEQWVEKTPSLNGKVVALTGTTSGTGYHTATLAIRNNVSHLFLLNRASSRSTKASEDLKAEIEKAKSDTKIYEIECDLMKFSSVKNAAEKINESCKDLGGLNVLGNNAGIMMFPDDRTEDGYDLQMQVNHLSHFLLTKLLMPSFELALEKDKEVRIVHHSSPARFLLGTDLAAKYFEQQPKGRLGGTGQLANFQRYHQTKLSNAVMAMKLHEQLQAKGYDTNKIKAVVAEPGIAKTALARTTSSNQTGFVKNVWGMGNSMFEFFMGVQSGEDGSVPFAHACFMDGVSSGDFYVPEHLSYGKPKRSVHEGVLDQGKKKQEKNVLSKKTQDLLWAESEKACGSFFEFATQAKEEKTRLRS